MTDTKVLPMPETVAHDLSRYGRRAKTRELPAEEIRRPGTSAGVRAGTRNEVRTGTGARTKTAAASASMRVSLFGVLVFILAVCVTLYIVYNYMQLSVIVSANETAQRELTALKKEERLLQNQLSNKIDLMELERIALHELGMIKPERENICFIDLSGQERAVVIESDSFWHTLKQAFGTMMLQVTEYLS